METKGGAKRDVTPVLELRKVGHWYGSLRVLHDVNLEILPGEIVGIVGPSGCGKSTLLRAILGTHLPCTGQVLVNGHTITGPGRERGMVYQRYSLFPFLTAEENVAFGPLLDQTTLPQRLLFSSEARQKKKEFLERARELLIKLKLEHALAHYPSELSGGMRQRVAIAQALIMKPQILLLDEPFGALDEATREELQEMLLDLYAENVAARERGEAPPCTVFIVTHELNEAIYVSDRVLGLSQYWDWKGAGHTERPGAMITYDAVAPVFSRASGRDLTALRPQREEIRSLVFEPKELVAPETHRRFWRELEAGQGEGMLAR